MQTVTLQDVVLAIADNLRDLTMGRTSATPTGTTQMQDSSRADRGKDKYWENSQIIFLEPAATLAGRTGINPFEVRGFISAQGIFTLDQDWNNATGVPQGLEYAIIRTRGQGAPFRTYLSSIKYTLDKLDLYLPAEDTSIVTAVDEYEYVVPTTLDTVYDVYVTPPNGRPYILRGDWWDVAPGRRIVFPNRLLPVGMGLAVTLRGRKRADVPTNLGDTFTVPFDEMIDGCVEYMLRNSPRAQEAAKANNLTQERLRFNNTFVYPNEREIY